jgi:CBS domain-containing protein
MIKVKDIMTADVITISADAEITLAAKILLENRINGVPVIDTEGKLVGILCQSDLVAQQKAFPVPSVFTLMDGIMPLTSIKRLEKEIEKIAAVTVADAMTPNPVTVGLETPIEEVASMMVDKSFHTLPVMEDDMLVGIVGKEDVLKILIPAADDERTPSKV